MDYDEIKNLDKKCILVVDDDREFTEAVCIALERLFPQMTLLKAYDGNRALGIIENRQPAIIILDMMLPIRSGFLVLEKVRRDQRNRPYIIMVTANVGERHKAFAKTLGVDKYIRKPFDMDILMNEVVSAVEQIQQLTGGE